jgi:hypothetical protein
VSAYLKAIATAEGGGYDFKCRMHTNDGFIYDGAARRLVDQKILEVESCSIDAGANCVFFYRRSRQCLRIDTVGEQVREMKATRWTSECPSSEDVLKPK